MHHTQSNTRRGAFPVLAGEALAGLSARLLVLTHDTGIPEVKLPAANTDLAFYINLDEVADAELTNVEFLNPEKTYRVTLKGTCNPGDQLVLADVGTAADKGKVRKLPVGAGTYRVIALAEEAGIDGQAVLIRPAFIGNVVVT